MTRLDRYILRNLVKSFAFFALVFTGVVWLTQAVRLIDTVVGSGQGGRLLLEVSTLVLPQVFVIVLPIAGIGATLYALNRLYSDSELVVMMSAGISPVRLLRPVLMFGVPLGLAVAVVLVVFVPRSGATLALRTQELRTDIAASLVVERQFLHPVPGLTLFIEDVRNTGELAGLFLHDQRDPARPVTYSAESALLLAEGLEARLVMRDGVALSLGGAAMRLTSVEYEQFVFDLSDLVQPRSARTPRPSEYWVGDLLRPTPAMLARGNFERGDYVAEGHYKLTQPMLATVYPALALVTLLAGGYRRSGFGRRVVVAVCVAVLLQAVAIVVRAQVQDDARLWPLMYLPILLGAAYVTALLFRLQTAGRRALA